MPARKQPRPDGGESFSFADVLKVTNATRSNLIHWTNIGIIKPDVEDTAGPGYPRRFSALNLIEAQLAWTLNRLRIPVATIGDALRALREFHGVCAAIWSVGQPLEGRKFLTHEEREAIKHAHVEQYLRREGEAGVGGSKSRRYYMRLENEAESVMFSDDQQLLLLHHAEAWREFTISPYSRFYGLFVFPEDGGATVADEPLGLAETIQHVAIVVNLAPVVDYVRLFAAGRPL
jgi:DNA-binding transcriptional MerR regulator